MNLEHNFLNYAKTLVAVIVTSVLLNACGGGGGGSSNSNPSDTAMPMLALFAGNLGGPGNVDGTGAVVSFNGPGGVATDSAGNVYVADTNNNTIRKITPAGVVSTLAGTPGVYGSANGIGAAASFRYPLGIATDSAGNLYVTDSGNNTIRKITPAGVVSTLAGTVGTFGSTNGAGTAAYFSTPRGIAADSAGNLYVVEDSPTIRKITPAGVVSTLAGTPGVYGSANGIGAAASFRYPKGIATDSTGNLYVTDSGNNTIRKITPAGVVSTLAGTPGVSGSSDGSGTAASFYDPRGLTIDSADNLYMVDGGFFAGTYGNPFYGNNTIRKITPAGVVSTLAGTPGVSGSADGSGTVASFDNPNGIATDSAGNLYVSDSGNNTIRKITPAGMVSTLAGMTAVVGSIDGSGAAASFEDPKGIATDSVGNVYVADRGNFNGRTSSDTTIRKITPAGVVSTLIADTGTSGDEWIAADSVGNLYVTGGDNHSIRKFSPAGVVSVLAGTVGVSGSADGSGAAASFYTPGAIATDDADNLYVVDSGNYTVRKITPAGAVSTLAGTPGMRGSIDGSGAGASFWSPQGIAADSKGNVYVADSGNNTIRKITPAGLVSTLAGTDGVSGSADGSGTAASFNSPQGIVTDSAGNLYVADSGNNIIRKITPAGVVTTVVGVAGKVGFAAGTLPGSLTTPFGVALSGKSLYITSPHGVAVVTDVP